MNDILTPIIQDIKLPKKDGYRLILSELPGSRKLSETEMKKAESLVSELAYWLIQQDEKR